ncbi:Ion channel [Alkalibacterium putridalgicola]|uniref:Ion channel n=1 Tax=Alkalibacterium putridalgicola TaxID=426703 RepID=A0A1H7W1E4_9LACT|nr:potassium channel family protein [Alkalibacterium putridalgicola]GEK88666.1 putative membrane protein YdjJ [Alkalibacterium putridalgicola]SEM15134.1 Ion channel [Alkalibacterium putridalgicola]
MSYIYYILGFGLTIFTIIDVIWTTLWIDGGAGPLSKRVAHGTWRIVEKALGKKNKLLTLVGPIVLMATLLSWVIFMWAGYTLFFAGDTGSIVDSSNMRPIGWTDRLYFTGYTIFTLGIGDFTPKPGFWQVVTAFGSGIGILFLTLGASYVINVVGAVVNKRSFARSISGLGMTSEEIMKAGWNGKDFHQLDLLLMNASADISKLTQQHQAYPLLHYYHSQTPEEASAVGVAILDDLMTILHYGLKDKDSVNAVLVKETRSSIETYLDTLTSAFVKPSESEPDRPDITRLFNMGIPFVKEEEFMRDLDTLSRRRQKLLGAVYSDNHDWPTHKKNQ